MNNHTPGPWQADNCKVYKEPFNLRSSEIAVCVSPRRSYSEEKANAEMMATAPELYKALGAFLSLIIDHYVALEKLGAKDEVDVCMNDAERVMVKAQGLNRSPKPLLSSQRNRDE